MDKQQKKENALEFDDKTLGIIRSAFEDRALWLYFLHRQMKAAIGDTKADEIAKKAIYEYGKLKGNIAVKSGVTTPEDWIRKHNIGGNHAIFSSDTKITHDGGEQEFNYCPLVEAWKKIGCSKEEIEHLCDIAMEGDYGMADAMGIKMEIPKKIACGDNICHFVLKMRK